MKKFAVLHLFLVSISLASYAQNVDLDTFLSDSLDHHVEREMNRWDLPGMAICVVRDGKVLVSKGYGVREKGKQGDVDEETLFMIGSNTKAFVATSVAMLEEKGKCSLNDRVQKWVPGFTQYDPWVAKNAMLSDILTHRLGFGTFQGDFIYWGTDLTKREFFEKFGSLKPKYDFRTKYGYCNAGYAVAGEVIQKVSGVTWDEYIQKNILDPIGMDRTSVLSQDLSADQNAARPHNLVGKDVGVIPYGPIGNLNPAGSISSSTEDMSKWLITLLDSGRYKGQQIIPWDAIARTRQAFTITNPVRYSLYGLGWELNMEEGKLIISHTGGVEGFLSYVQLIPEDKLGIVVLTNSLSNYLFYAMGTNIRNAHFNKEYQNISKTFFQRYATNLNEVETRVKEMRDSVELKFEPPVSLKKMEGKYQHDIYGWAELKLDRDKNLQMKLEHHPDLTGKLEYIGNNRFLCTYSNSVFGIKAFPFKFENGGVIGFTLYVDEFLDPNPYYFNKL